MTKELQAICEKYKFNEDIVKILTSMEMVYDTLEETEKEQFLFGLGGLIIELGSRLQSQERLLV